MKKNNDQKPETFIRKAYSLGEEIFSSTTHGLGAMLSIAAMVVMIVISVSDSSPIKLASSIVFGLSLFVLYMMSTLYHAIRAPRAKKVFKILDHCTIYILIAGTYTPYTLVGIGGSLGWLIFGVVWGAAILGILLNAIDIKRYKWISFALYVAMGWAIVFAIKPMIEALPIGAIIYLAVGGLFYTGGIIFYLMKSKKYFHSIWHLFVLLGSISHILGVIFYVLR